MITKPQLEEFSLLVAERIRAHLAASDPMKPRVMSCVLENGKAKLNGDALISDPEFSKPAAIPRMVDALLAVDGIVAVAVAHEAWVTKIPNMAPELFAQTMGHLAFMADGRAEGVIQALHGVGFQTAVLHGVDRSGATRRLTPGPMVFDALSLGGAMARDMPTKH